MWFLDETSASSIMTIAIFMNNCLKSSIEDIFEEINKYIFITEVLKMEPGVYKSP